MKMSPQGTLKELEKAQPSITGKYVMLWEHSAPRTALEACSFVIVTVELAVLGCGLAWDVAWEGIVEGWLWFCAIFWSGDLLFPSPLGSTKTALCGRQRRGEFRLSQLPDAVGCDPRGVRLDQCSIEVQRKCAGYERRPHQKGHAALPGHRQTPDTAAD